MAQMTLGQRMEKLRWAIDPLPGSIPQDNIRPIRIPGRLDGWVLIDCVCELHPPVSRQTWTQWFAQGHIRRQGVPSDPKTEVRGGEEFEHVFPDTVEPDVNPEVLAPTYSEEQKMEQEQAQDVNVDKPSTGAQVGNERFDPARDGALRNLPSPWRFTNRDGLQDPVPASHASTDIRGAPQNDLLDEEAGEAVALNAKEYLYAGYLNRIRRLVNFYWEQNLDNLPRGTPFAKTAYRTDVGVVLTSVGGLDRIEVTKDSGSELMDMAVVKAFELAGPFPNPPDGLIEKDGRVYLPDMSFTVRLGTARLNFDGVDPRAGVQFPGLMKSPR